MNLYNGKSNINLNDKNLYKVVRLIPNMYYWIWIAKWRIEM